MFLRKLKKDFLKPGTCFMRRLDNLDLGEWDIINTLHQAHWADRSL